jgi:uncharacterized membrane protein
MMAQLAAAQGRASNAAPAGGILFPVQIGNQQPAILQQTWQGPFPPPEAIERYENILPGAFDRIVGMAEKMGNAQIHQSELALINQHKTVATGQWLGFAAIAICAACGAALGVFGQPWLAAAFLAVPAMGVAKALVDSARAPAAANTPSTDAKPDAPAPR